MLADCESSRAWRPGGRRRTHVAVGVLLAGVLTAGCSGGTHNDAATSADPSVRRAQAEVNSAPPPLSAYRGPANGPPAQPPAPVVFVAADLTDGGIGGVARGVQEAAHAIGWPLQIIDGQANVDGERQALVTALRLRPGGIILGGVNAADQRPLLQEAQAQGVPVVGWHSTATPGPAPKLGLFTNVTSDPALVGRLAADYAIEASNGTAGVVIFTDPEYAIDTRTANAMASEIRSCRDCSVLQEATAFPIATASTGVEAAIEFLLQRFGKRWSYLLAVNGAYIDGASVALTGAGLSGDQAPFSVAAGEGDESEFARIRENDYQAAAVAEPLNLQGWQLIDELNRARARQPPSGYVAPPRLITQSDVPSGAVFDPLSGYRQNYLRIWRR